MFPDAAPAFTITLFIAAEAIKKKGKEEKEEKRLYYTGKEALFAGDTCMNIR
jgi:hypothetical protein